MAARSPSSVEYRSTALDQNIPVTPATPLPTVSGASGATADQVQGNIASGVADSGNPVKIGGKAASTSAGTGTFTDGQRADAWMTSQGAQVMGMPSAVSADGLSDNLAFPAVTNGVTLRPMATSLFKYNGTTFDRDTKSITTSRIASSAATTNGTAGKGSAGTLHAVTAYNTSATVKYLKVYNKATAPTVGTDTPILTLALKPTDSFVMNFPQGLYCSAGISYALTGAAADGDATALAAGDVTAVALVYA